MQFLFFYKLSKRPDFLQYQDAYVICPYNGERLCSLWGTSLRLRNNWLSKHIVTFTRQVLETRYPPVHDRRKRKHLTVYEKSKKNRTYRR